MPKTALRFLVVDKISGVLHLIGQLLMCTPFSLSHSLHIISGCRLCVLSCDNAIAVIRPYLLLVY